MPTRSYFFPNNFRHLEEVLESEGSNFSAEVREKFRNNNIAPIVEPGNLPIFLGISPKIIFSIRRKAHRHYRSFDIRKKNGSIREINSPRTYLKVIQWWILDNILTRIELPDHIFGFAPGRSAVQNAIFHSGANHVLNVDIVDFFPSISKRRVESVFRDLGYSHDVAKLLSELCTLDDRLPQGAPTSPAIANLVLRSLDRELANLARNARCIYSRYADDLTFSSKTWIENEFLQGVEAAIKNAGFRLNRKKTRFAGKGDQMEVTGIVINDVTQPTRTWRQRTRAKLHRLDVGRRLTRRDLSYLHGISGMGAQFPDSVQMMRLSAKASAIAEEKSSTVVGRGQRPVLPDGLTMRQAEALAALTYQITNAEIADKIQSTEATVRNRLQEAYKKIGVENREEAIIWSRKNI